MKAPSILAVMLLASGCGQSPAIVSATNPFRSATDICRETGAQDDAIDFYFTLFRSLRQDGASSSEVLMAAMTACQNVYPIPSESVKCATCCSAIIDEVYGL